MTIQKERRSRLTPCFTIETCSYIARRIAMPHKSSVLSYFSENAQDVVQHIFYLLPDATLHIEELKIIASKVSDIIRLADMSVTLAETILSIINYILLQKIEDQNIRKMTNR